MTIGGPSSNTACVFPFGFNGVIFNECTFEQAIEDAAWCSTEVDSRGNHLAIQGKWGFCGKNCPIPNKPGPGKDNLGMHYCYKVKCYLVKLYLDRICGRIRSSSVQQIEVNSGPDHNPPGTWPWMGSLGKVSLSGKWVHQCGATLLTNTFALTAAHCLVNFNEANLKVLFGVTNHTIANVSEAIGVKRISIHEKYEDPIAYFDIAVVELVEPLQFTSIIVPICLPQFPSRNIDSIQGHTVDLMGWGKRVRNKGSSSKHLRSTTLTIFAQR